MKTKYIIRSIFLMKFWNTNQNNWTDHIPTEFETESEALLFAKNLTNFEIIKMYVNEQ